MKEIELFKSLHFNTNVNFQKHMINIQQKNTYFIIKYYLQFIGNTDINIKDFLSLITINLYNNEFNINDEEKIYIKNYIDKYDYINNYKELNIKDYYNTYIKKDNLNILQILKKILNRTSNDVLNHYTKMYYFYNNLHFELKNEEIKKEKEVRLELLKTLLDNNINIDNFIKTKEKELNLDKQYNEFRKEIFFEMLNKDLTKQDISYDGILYLLDIIRIKLCFIAPVNKKYDYIKVEINNILDTKYIRQLISNQVFEFNNLINIFYFIIRTIKKFQSEDFDKKIEEIQNVIETKLLDDKCQINKILPSIIRNFIDIIEQIETDVIYYRSKINKI
tara:strand:- start:154 stop:1155 length:1002 start_codon:yes stop_codon:yes gene_type:complete